MFNKKLDSGISTWYFLHSFMHNDEKCPKILLKYCGVNNVRFLMYVWPFFYIMQEKVESEIFSNKEFHIRYYEKLTSKLLVNSTASGLSQFSQISCREKGKAKSSTAKISTIFINILTDYLLWAKNYQSVEIY